MMAKKKIAPSVTSSLKDSYYTNSMWMVLASLASAGAGFLFWILAAKLFSSEEVGLASALISSGLLIVSISRLGFEQAIIRFFPDKNQSTVYTSIMMVIMTVCVIMTISFFFSVNALSSSLSFIRGSYLVFFVFVFSSSLLSLTGSVFVAKKRSFYYFVQSVIGACRLLFLPILITFGTLGILGSLSLATVITTCFSLLFVSNLGVHIAAVDRQFLKDSFSFSISNYSAGLLMMAPGLLLPIIALNTLGTNAAAYYYMSYSMASFLFIVPNALSTSLFVEGSHGVDLSQITKKAIRTSFLSLTLLVVVVVTLGYFLLSFLGPGYVQNGYGLLVLMSISSFPIALVQIAFSTLLVKKSLKNMVLLGFVQFTAVLFAVSYLIGPFGLDGIGFGWLFGNTLVALVSIMMLLNNSAGPSVNHI